MTACTPRSPDGRPAVPSPGVNAGTFFCIRFATLPGNIYPTQPSPYSNPFTVAVVVAIGKGGGDETSCSGNGDVYPFTHTRCFGSRWDLRRDTIFVDVRILGCCFGLCGAGARQLSHSIEERVNPRRHAAGPNILGSRGAYT